MHKRSLLFIALIACTMLLPLANADVTVTAGDIAAAPTWGSASQPNPSGTCGGPVTPGQYYMITLGIVGTGASNYAEVTFKTGAVYQFYYETGIVQVGSETAATRDLHFVKAATASSLSTVTWHYLAQPGDSSLPSIVKTSATSPATPSNYGNDLTDVSCGAIGYTNEIAYWYHPTLVIGVPHRLVTDLLQTAVFDAPAFGSGFTLTPLSTTELIGRWSTDTSGSPMWYHTYLGSAPGFTLDATTYRANTTQLSGSFTGLLSQTSYCARVRSINADGTTLTTSNEACATTLAATLVFIGNRTRVVPDNVTLYINRPAEQEYVVDCVRFDPSGAIQNACTADAWGVGDGNNYTFRYPQSIVHNTTNGDVGEYHVYVVNETGIYVGGATFCIQQAWSGSCNVTVGADIQTELGSSSLAEVAGIAAEKEVAVNKATEIKVRGAFLHFLDVLFREDVFIPNILWGYIVMIFVGLIGIGTNARRS